MAVSAATIAQALKGTSYPASKQDLIRAAESNGADQSVINDLQNLDTDRFASIADVEKAFGQEK